MLKHGTYTDPPCLKPLLLTTFQPLIPSPASDGHNGITQRHLGCMKKLESAWKIACSGFACSPKHGSTGRPSMADYKPMPLCAHDTQRLLVLSSKLLTSAYKKPKQHFQILGGKCGSNKPFLFRPARRVWRKISLPQMQSLACHKKRWPTWSGPIWLCTPQLRHKLCYTHGIACWPPMGF